MECPVWVFILEVGMIENTQTKGDKCFHRQSPKYGMESDLFSQVRVWFASTAMVSMHNTRTVRTPYAHKTTK